jgi:hypothetical protein
MTPQGTRQRCEVDEYHPSLRMTEVIEVGVAGQGALAVIRTTNRCQYQAGRVRVFGERNKYKLWCSGRDLAHDKDISPQFSSRLGLDVKVLPT